MPFQISADKVLDNARFNRIVRDQDADLILRQPLLFYERTPKTDADDAEIITTFTGKVYAADLIADDQEAAVYQGGSFTMALNNIPNIKSGVRLGQAQLARLSRLSRNSADAGESDFYANWERNVVQRGVLSGKQRVNALICAMQMDTLAYSRFGIKVSGTGSWGMPSDLKVTTANAWSDATNATPVTDLLTMRDAANFVHGENYNRATMARATFFQLTKSAEFGKLISGAYKTYLPPGSINAYTGEAREAVSRMLDGMEIELHDTVYRAQAEDGTDSSVRVQPANKVILSSTADDNNTDAMDFANGIVTESIVASLDDIDGFGGPSFGPIGYYTRRSDMNPPDVTAWVVARGWPRKFRLTATAVLTVG